MKYLIGIQPTGKIHIGNYLGCIRKGIQLHKEGHIVTFLIANYHSLTTDNYTDITEKELRKLGEINECNLNIVHQTPEYMVKFFELCCKMNVGILQKMPQFKEKNKKTKFDLGILLYPVLMTVDIIMNDPDIVIVGKDQVPHLELCNDIAKRIGGKKKYRYEFGDVDKIMSLKDPDKKMSKSLGEKHVLYCFDDHYNKLRKANGNDKGIRNLKQIAKHLDINIIDNISNLELKETISVRMIEIFKK